MSRDLTGRKFGRLRVSHVIDFYRSGVGRYFCICDCGGDRIAPGNILGQGKITDCLPCEEVNKPYHPKVNDRDIQHLSRTLRDAGAPLTRDALHARAMMPEERLYDTLAVLMDRDRLKVRRVGEVPTYALAA